MTVDLKTLMTEGKKKTGSKKTGTYNIGHKILGNLEANAGFFDKYELMEVVGCTSEKSFASYMSYIRKGKNGIREPREIEVRVFAGTEYVVLPDMLGTSDEEE